MTLSPDQQTRPDSEIRIYLIAALLFSALTFWHFISNALAISGDTAMYLQCGQFLLDGKVPYQDFQDLNPPLIMYVSVLPALMSKVTSIPLAQCGIVFTTVLTLLALWLSLSVTRFIHKAMPDTIAIGELFAPALLAPCLINALASFDYGQREHYFAIFLLPFFYLRWYRYKSAPGAAEPPAWLTIITGMMLGFTLSFKPYFFLPPAMLELYWLLRYRRPRLLVSPECLAAAVPVVVYALHFLLLPAQARDLYFHNIAPLLVHGYACFNIVKDVVVNLIFIWAISTYFIALALAGLVVRKDMRAPLLILISTALAIVEIQQKFWTYHNIPLYMFVTVTFMMAVAKLCQKAPAALRAALLTSLTGLFCVGSYVFHSSVEAHWPTPWDKSLALWSRPGDKAMLLDSSDTPWFKSAVRFDLRPGSRYLWLFAVPMLEFEIKNARTAAAAEAGRSKLAALFKNINDDFASYKPDFILVNRKRAFGMPDDSDLLAYVKEHGLAQSLDSYETMQACGDFDLLVRKDLKATRKPLAGTP